MVTVAYDSTGVGGTAHAQTLNWSHTFGNSATAAIAAITNYGYALAPTAWTSAVNICTPVTYDATGAGNNGTSSPVTETHVVGASANAIIVAVSGYDATAAVGYNSFTWNVTYNSVPLTRLCAVNLQNATASGFVMLFGLLSPSTGSNTVSVGWSGGSGTLGVYVNSVSYSGVGQVQAIGTNFGSSTALNSGAIASEPGDLVLSAQAIYDKTIASPSGTSRYNQPTSVSASYATLLIQDTAGLAGATTMTSTGSASANWGTASIGLGAANIVRMKSLGAINLNNVTSSDGFVQLWGAINPPTGAQTVCASYVITADTPFLYGDSVAYTGCAQFGTGVLNSGSSTALTSGNIVSAIGNMVVSAQGIYDKTIASPSATSRYNAPGTSTTDYITLLIQDSLGASTVSLTSTGSGSATWGVASVNLIAGTQWQGNTSLAIYIPAGTDPFPVTFPYAFGGEIASGTFVGRVWTGSATLAMTANTEAGVSSIFPVTFPFVWAGTGPTGARTILGPPLRYMGRYPDSDAVIVPASYAVADNAATAVSLNWIDSQTAIAAANLVNDAWVNQQVANYTSESQVTTALSAYVPESTLGAASGIAQLGANEEIPSGQLPVLVTNSLAVSYDAVSVGTVYLASNATFVVTSTTIGAYVIASVNIPDPGYPWIPFPIAYVQGYAGGASSGTRLAGNGNSGLLTVTPPISTSAPVVYGAGLMTDDPVANYYQCVPGAITAAGVITPLTQTPVSGSLTLQLSASCWSGNNYTVSGAGLVFYVLVLPAQGG
jgi:hypothetical protein